MNERKYNTPYECVQNILIVGELYAQARADHEDANNYRKTVRAIAFLESSHKTDKAREADSLRCQQYLDECAKMKVARVDMEKYRYELKSAELKIEIWRSKESTRRQEITATGMAT
jgi:hypothetical protein